MENTIRKYIDPIIEDENHRYKSWEHCYNAFGNKNELPDVLALHLGFYLASWGMYRGSSKLLQKDYKIHKNAVTIILSHYHLRDIVINNLLPEIKSVEHVIKDLSHFYSEEKITPTDTLISKIILGTLGCLPAFDRYFNMGFSKGVSTLNMKNIEEVWRIAEVRKPEIEIIQNSIYTDSNFWYPTMKIIDMINRHFNTHIL